ncbi:OST-HTH/LOTUS domain-containing protein [Demequina sp.]|uniref:OST-HTH/LOTUS domain-containing protein n=1 Tax=Demequina sp. TaxID=2050685 RepID=UPI00344D025C
MSALSRTYRDLPTSLSAGRRRLAHLGAAGSNLSRLASDFDTRSRGLSKLTELLKAHPGYDVQSRSPGDGKPKVSVVRS